MIHYPTMHDSCINNVFFTCDEQSDGRTQPTSHSIIQIGFDSIKAEHKLNTVSIHQCTSRFEYLAFLLRELIYANRT